MAGLQTLRRSAVALVILTAGACAGNQLGNVLGGVLGGGASNNQLSGTIRGVDTRSQQISIQTSNGQTVPVYYDNQTQVVYQNQNYPATALEYGDMITARIQTNGNNYYTDYIQVDQSANGNGTVNSGNVQQMQGNVRSINRQNGFFTVDVGNYNTITVTLPYNVSSNDVNRFNSLRVGDFVRFYGVFTGQSQVQLRQFN